MKTYEIQIERTEYYPVLDDKAEDLDTAIDIAFEEVFENCLEPDYTSNDVIETKTVDLA